MNTNTSPLEAPPGVHLQIAYKEEIWCLCTVSLWGKNWFPAYKLVLLHATLVIIMTVDRVTTSRGIKLRMHTSANCLNLQFSSQSSNIEKLRHWSNSSPFGRSLQITYGRALFCHSLAKCFFFSCHNHLSLAEHEYLSGAHTHLLNSWLMCSRVELHYVFIYIRWIV